jgi:Dullard-like phosphatase family protein
MHHWLRYENPKTPKPLAPIFKINIAKIIMVESSGQ